MNAKIGSCQEFFLFKKRVLQKSRTFFLNKKEKNWYNEKEQKEEKRRVEKGKKELRIKTQK